MANEKRRYEIFISSPKKGLENARKALICETIEQGHIPSAMELFIAGGGLTSEVIDNNIEKADIFAILVGSNWGSEVDKDREQSFTELELTLALKYKKPIIAFLENEEEAKEKRSKYPHGHPERGRDEEYDKLRKLVKQDANKMHRVVKYFSEKEKGIDTLRRSFALELQEAIRRFDETGGWIRSEIYDKQKESIHLNESVSKNRFFKRFANRLNTFDILSSRCSLEEPLKEAIAETFWDQYLARMIENNVRNFFFESGSSIAFVAEAFIKRLKTEKWLRDVSERLNVGTNNLLVYLDFILSDQIEYIENVDLYPRSQPEAKYGATFGSKLMEAPRREPPSKPSILTAKARVAVDDIRDKLNEIYPEKESIILMAASGIEITLNSDFPGPHVGSYYNKLFKRAIFESSSPKVIFLDGDKLLKKPFNPGVCYPVCDKEGAYSWDSICKDKPLAIAIASYQNKDKEIEKKLEDLGFQIILSKIYKNEFHKCKNEMVHCEADMDVEEEYEGPSVYQDIYTIIAANSRFQDLWNN